MHFHEAHAAPAHSLSLAPHASHATARLHVSGKGVWAKEREGFRAPESSQHAPAHTRTVVKFQLDEHACVQVPMDQGANALHMIHKFTRNKALAAPPTRTAPLTEWALLPRASSSLTVEE